MFKLVLEKAEEPEIKLSTSTGSWKKQESSRKTSISALLTMPKPLTVWITINFGKFWKRWEYQTTWPASWEICVQVRKQQLEQIGRAHVWTPVTQIHLVCRLLLDCVDHNKLWKILKEMGIPDHLTCLLRNLCAGQEATIRTGHQKTDWFQIGKGVRQGCILSPCWFNLYSEYII